MSRRSRTRLVEAEIANPAKKKNRVETKQEADAQEEQRLTQLLFGPSGGTSSGAITEQTRKLSQKKGPKKEEEGAGSFGLFQVDRVGEEVDEETEPEQSNRTSQGFVHPDDGDSVDEADEEERGETPAWLDDDDDKIEVDLYATSRLRKLRTSRNERGILNGVQFEERIRQRYETTMQRTAQTGWAKIDPTDELTGDGEGVEGSSNALVRSSGQRLPAHALEIIRCRDANLDDPSQSVIRALDFLPGSDPDEPILLTAGLDKTLRFFQVGAEKSKKVHGMHFPKLPITSASFLGDTGNVIVSGRSKGFYIYDAAAGRLDLIPGIPETRQKSFEYCVASPNGRIAAFRGMDGYIILYDVKAKQWISNLKLNGKVDCVAFSPNGENVIAGGSDGEVYCWDTRSRKCCERFANQDGTGCTSLAMSNTNIAVGARSGVVNLYSGLPDVSNDRTPIKSFMNMQTSVDRTCFNEDGQILAMTSSADQKSGLKIAHVPSATVFSNWPTQRTPLSYVWSVAFSPGSKFLALGNDKGKCLLFELKYYR